MMKFMIIFSAMFLGYRTLAPFLRCIEQNEFVKAMGYITEFGCVVFLLYHFGGLI